jgi:hypothetical protein
MMKMNLLHLLVSGCLSLALFVPSSVDAWNWSSEGALNSETVYRTFGGTDQGTLDRIGGVDLRADWSWTPLMGFVYTGEYPYVYSLTNEEWIWLHPEPTDVSGGGWFWRYGSLHWGWTSVRLGDQYYDHRWDHMRPFVIEGSIRGLAVAAVEHETIRAIAVHDSGEKLMVFDDIGSEPGESRRGAMFETQEGLQIFIYAPADGLPDRIQIGNHIFLFSNYTETTVDIAEVDPDGDVTIRRAVEIDPSALAELRALNSGLEFAPMSSGGAESMQFVNWDAVKRDLPWAGVAVGTAFCGVATALVKPVGLACAGALIAVVRELRDADDVALEASAVAVGAISCGTGSYAECLPLLIDGGVMGITAVQAILADRDEEVANVRELLEADDESENMVLVEGGTLAMSMGTRTVETFWIGKYEVTWGEWQAVQAWGEENGYEWPPEAGRGCAEDHPVHSLNWYDAVKWSNAKSEMNDLEPVYRVGGVVYREGEPTLRNCAKINVA